MGLQVGGEKSGAISEMNVVPLIDILLVLIIIFMVITPLMSRGLEAVLPQPAEQTRPPVAGTVVVQVGAGGWLKINQEETSWDTLGRRLTEIFRARADKVAFVRGDAPVEFAQVARAISVMRRD